MKLRVAVFVFCKNVINTTDTDHVVISGLGLVCNWLAPTVPSFPIPIWKHDIFPFGVYIQN